MARRTLGASVALIWLCAVVAHADDDSEYARSGAYVGLGASWAFDMAVEDAIEDLLDALPADETYLETESTFGVNARFGYRFFSHLAGEMQLEYLTGFDTEGRVLLGSGAVLAGEIEHKILAFTTNAKVPLFTGALQPFLLAGVGIVYAQVEDEIGAGLSMDDTDFAVRAGGGLDVFLSEHIAFSVDATYVYPTGRVEDLDFLSVNFGIHYHF